MNRRFLTRPGAEQDIRSRFRFLAREAGIEVANRFQSSVWIVVQELLERPDIGWPVRSRPRRLAGLRCWPVPGFEKILVFYLPTPAGIEVVRVLHGAQDIERILREER